MNKPTPASVFGRRQSSEALNLIEAEKAKSTEENFSTVDNEPEHTWQPEFTLGNPELPVAAFRQDIVESVDNHQATIITAETGAGKSTQIPQYLAESGYKVIVTQPRIVAARNLSKRVRQEVVAKRGQKFEDFVGYRTAKEYDDDETNRILYVTDGLQMVRELAGHGVGSKQALVLDEVHEWNENMEVLVAWSKQRMSEDSNFKVVVMSATMEAKELSEYYSDEGGLEAPVFEVPGRTFEVSKKEGGLVFQEAIKSAKEGKNTLVFMPGKAEIKEVMLEFEYADIPNVTVLPLHGDMDAGEQQKAFKNYAGVKVIVATNVAQTSLTIPGIDAVVDSGLERQSQFKNGVKGLYLNPISQADCLQRAGRAGREKPGEYILAQLDGHAFIPLDERKPYATPAILRSGLDGMVLRLAKNRLDASEMDFFHNKDEEGNEIKPKIIQAKQRLIKLGALTETGEVTFIGREMDRLPLESHNARMMIEARRYGETVQTQLAALLAVQEVQSIVRHPTGKNPFYPRWRELIKDGNDDSSMIHQLEVFIAAQSMSNQEKKDHHIFPQSCSKAMSTMRQLRKVERLEDQNLTLPTKEEREQLVKCIIAGQVDNLYTKDPYGKYSSASGDSRLPSNRNTVVPNHMIVGSPFNLDMVTSRGPKTMFLLEAVTNVPSVDVLREVAPQLFKEEFSNLSVEADGRVYEISEVIFNGLRTGQTTKESAPPSQERAELLAIQATDKLIYGELNKMFEKVTKLQHLSGESFSMPSADSITKRVVSEMPATVETIEEAMNYVPNFRLEDFVSTEKQAQILTNSPEIYGGMSLRYYAGRPTVDSFVSNEQLAELDDSWLKLPDGRDINFYDYSTGSHITLSIAKQQAVESQARKKREQELEQQFEKSQAEVETITTQLTEIEEQVRKLGDLGLSVKIRYHMRPGAVNPESISDWLITANALHQEAERFVAVETSVNDERLLALQKRFNG